jgi:AcrR family transcriptional regulator
MPQTQKAAGDPQRAAAADSHGTERLQLMAAAEQVLERGGWWGFKLESVLRQARLSTRSFYRHFDGKEDLLSALLEGELLAIADYLKSLGDNASSPVERVWLYIDSLIDLSFDQRIVKPASLFALHWRKLLPEYPDVVQRCTLALTTPLAGVLDEGHRAGALSCSDPAADAKAIFFLISSTVFDRPNLTGQDPRALAEHIVLPFVQRALRVKLQRPVSRRSAPVLPVRPETGPAGLQFTLAKHAWDMSDCAS